MKCYSCQEDAVAECRRCGRLYCDEHGDELCGECLKPVSALPSYLLYRGSLLTLLVGTAVALWLLLKPPEEASESVPQIIAPTAARASPTAPPAATSAQVTLTPSPVSPTATATPEGPIEYVIGEGDTLFDIAERNLPPGEDLTEFAQAIAGLNGLDPENPVLQPGQTLLIPR
jgi:hypothetical protein